MRRASMTHVTVAGDDAGERGRQVGEALADRLPAVWSAYLSLFETWAGVPPEQALRFGADTLALVGGWRPDVAAEIEGVAAGAGMAPEAIAALNARTELVAGAECSTVGRTGGPAGPWLAQNWDWYLDAPERCVVVARPGHVTFTEAGILAKVGVNDAGLAVSLNVLGHRADERRPTATPIHLLLHQVLARCCGLDQVAALLEAADPAASSCITVVTSDGDGASFEVSPAGVARIDPDAEGFLHHTNHFLDPALASGDTIGEKLPRSCERDAVLAGRRPLDLAEARLALSDHSGGLQPVCRHGEPQGEGMPLAGTAAFVAMDPRRRCIEVGPGPTCTTTTEAFDVGR